MKYVRKISRAEAECDFILISKQKRGMFPPPGRRFSIYHRRSRLHVVVEEVPCQCVGSDKPHVHYHLHAPVALMKGDVVQITKEGGKYTLTVKP